MEPCQTYEHNGVMVEIHYDEDAWSYCNPRDNDCNLGVMFCDHDRHNLGDSDAPDPREGIECAKCEGSGWTVQEDGKTVPGSGYGADEDECDVCKGEGKLYPGIVETLRQEHGARVVLPLYLYDHGGISMSAGSHHYPDAQWDVSNVGVIFDTAATRAECGFGEGEPTDEQIEEGLRGEVDEYDKFIRGEVYGYVIDRLADTEDEETGETIRGADLPAGFEESCWGFIGSDYIVEEANAAADGIASQLADEARETFEMACRDIVTVAA